ncbi:hypothetical protein CDL15_Pgr005284 [Punica granatum]|uniref:Uncharacterized protein n=1 Tax=Punica granatum TaxID=22663 RepID=A0A218XD67_PUNGR|nr:hypothetical protein CDL15_Pgr005284 [Punica granatum]
MAQCAASASCIKLHLCHGTGERGHPPWRKSLFRKECYHTWDAVPLKAWKFRELSVSGPRVNVNLRQQATSFSCTCLGSLASFDGTTASEWVPIIDQVLLLASMLLTYMAGVTPTEKPGFTSPHIVSGDYMIPESSTFSGRATKTDEEVSKCIWDVIKRKLLDSLEVTQPAKNVEDEVVGLEQYSVKRPLSLNAVAEGPRLRLLLAVVMHLEKEVSNIQGNYGTSKDDWSKVLFGIIQNSLEPICISWLGKELLKDNHDADVVLPSSIVEKFKGDGTILLNIKKSGKEDLYADLFCFVRFGSVRDGSYYNSSLFISEGISILEDLVIVLADGIASIYLELISVDGSLSNEMNTLSSGLCSLSTRSLQKLRNEIALNQWLHQNMEAVASMYEDRFDLNILQSQFIEEPNSRTAENIGWWKNPFMKRSAATTYPLQCVAVSNFSMPVKRTTELRDLTGWRYYYSLFLELSDITMPLIRTVINKISNAISFFLVSLIGRSLGLIYTGIRQSLRWK